MLISCLSLCWMSVYCQDEYGLTKTPKIVPIPEQSQIQLKEGFCFSYQCLAKLTDPLEIDKVKQSEIKIMFSEYNL